MMHLVLAKLQIVTMVVRKSVVIDSVTESDVEMIRHLNSCQCFVVELASASVGLELQISSVVEIDILDCYTVSYSSFTSNSTTN